MAKKISYLKVLSTVKDNNLIEKRHNEIFNTTSKLFARKGYFKSGLREISKNAGISLGNLYNYITTKEDLLYIIHNKAAEYVLKEMEQLITETENPVEKLEKMIRIELNTMNKYEDLILLLYQESHALSKKYLRSMLHQESEHVQKFEKVLKKGIKIGVFKDINPTMVANIIKMMIDCWVIKRWDLRKKVTLREMAAGIIEIVMGGILSEKYYKKAGSA
jgi:AcrR family transcriptional regulator